MGKLFFIGDSITTGAWDKHGGWANRIIGQVMEKTMEAEFSNDDFYCLPYNLGVSGNTIEDILPRLKSEVTTRLDQNNPNERVELVFSIGVNDSVYLAQENKPRFSDDQFHDNLLKLISISNDIADRISFIGLLPVDDTVLNPIPWAPEKAYACEHVKRFENIIKSICEKSDLSFLPLFDEWKNNQDWQTKLMDGVHPNSDGHALLANQISNFLLTDDFVKYHSVNN